MEIARDVAVSVITWRSGVSESAREIMQDLAVRFFHNQCEVTHKEFEPKGFAIHHITEIENDVLRKFYPYSVKGRDDYLRDLKPLVEDQPDRFALIKNFVHTRLDHKRNGTTRFPMDQRIRFCDLALRTIHRRKKK